MADLLLKNTLALWTQNEPADVEIDPFAAEVIDKVSQLVQFLGGHEEWTLDGVTKAPFDVQMVVLQICKRTYANPDQEKSTTTGPIGSTVLDVAALLTDLTATERATLIKYNPAGDPDVPASGLWVLHTSRDPASLLPNPVILFADDDHQVLMSVDASAYPSWSIPLFSPGDPGEPVV